MKEIVIISGKGGTGKTSMAASFASLAKGHAVIADCDVDAADLHLILRPEIKHKTVFQSGHKAVIQQQKCISCGVCFTYCRFNAIKHDNKGAGEAIFTVDAVSCEGCGVCVRFCPQNAIDFPKNICGEWYVSQTRFGPMVHAKLGIAAENSGKLVTLVRTQAKKIAEEQGKEYVLIDGSPGIGCPVIASLTASSIALIVIEPTVSGDHDLRRIAQLTKQLGVPAMVCINKWDINPDVSENIRGFAQSQELNFAGTVRYDKAVTEAQMAEMTIIEFAKNELTKDIENIWERIKTADID